tara:strand:+ start:481 stop:846 length:366 start_codon:yes stop_codon:yes gene_type:complete
MAVTVTNQSNPLGAKIVQDTSATNSAVDDTTGNSGTLYMVEVDNTSYSTAVYFKLADTDNATVGTTAATMVFFCPASVKRSYVFPEGIAFSNGFSHWCTTAAAEASKAAPSTPPTVRYVTS